MTVGLIGIVVGSLWGASQINKMNNANNWVNKENRDPISYNDIQIIVYFNPEVNFYYAIYKDDILDYNEGKTHYRSLKGLETYCVKVNPNYNPASLSKEKRESCKYYIDNNRGDGVYYFNMEIRKDNKNDRIQFGNVSYSE